MRIVSSTQINNGFTIFLLNLLLLSTTTKAWTTRSWTLPSVHNKVRSEICCLKSSSDSDHPKDSSVIHFQSNRRTVLSTTAVTTVFTLATTVMTMAAVVTTSPFPAMALVKGVAPPPPKRGTIGGGSGTGDRPKCTNVEECQALAEQREAEIRSKEEAGPPPLVTTGGVKYRDLENGKMDGPSVKSGDLVSVYFKVLKLGKRSYDGLSGEGTVVFSRGYGLEDDEDKPGVKVFRTLVGSPTNIIALNDALVGMKVDGIRRFAILPQKGWERATPACDGGPGGTGTGGDLRTDYVVVPTATMVQQEACFDNTKLPFPTTYAQQRRMAQRFDQSLIMEVQLVDIQKGDRDMIL